jgi:hypothetical protein
MAADLDTGLSTNPEDGLMETSFRCFLKVDCIFENRWFDFQRLKPADKDLCNHLLIIVLLISLRENRDFAFADQASKDIASLQFKVRFITLDALTLTSSCAENKK